MKKPQTTILHKNKSYISHENLRCRVLFGPSTVLETLSVTIYEPSRNAKSQIRRSIMSSHCNVCDLLTFSRKRLRNGELRKPQWIPKDKLLSSSNKGCAVCKSLRQSVAAHIRWEKLSAIQFDSTFVTGTVTIRLRHIKSDVQKDITSTAQKAAELDTLPCELSKIVLFSPKRDRIPSLGAIGSAKHSYPSFAFKDRVRLIKSWIAECQREHPDCREKRKTPRSLPTRVLDVGDEEHEPYLYLTRGESAEYTALSHCWGPPERRSKQLLTRRVSFSQHCNAISLESMPKTFRDAVVITRALGIRYLWIDSLCIMQDDSMDWEFESSRMAQVYRNALITLAADWASNSDDGCFSPESDRKRNVASVPFKDPSDGRTYHIISRLLDEGCSIPTKETLCCHAEESISILNTRAWSLQEWLLSRRLIRFAKTELIWECITKSQCECRLREWKTFEEEKPLRELKHWISSGINISRADGWMGLVENYTSREITKISDRLPALSGLAAAIWNPSLAYYAGFWNVKLLSQITWRVVEKCNPGSPTHWERESKRHPTYYAPSWSWASVTGAVKFADLSEDWGSNDKIASIKQIVSKPATANPFGPVSEATLIMEAWVVEIDIVIVHSTTGPLDDKNSRVSKFVVRPKGVSEQPSLSETIQPDVLPPSNNELNDSNHSKFLLIFLYRRVHEKTSIARALVVKLVNDNIQNEESYQRVGYFECGDSWQVWEKHSTRKIITIK